MFEKRRVRAFVRFARDYGENRLLDCLETGERAGLRYHYRGKLVGDYDVPPGETGICRMLLELENERA